MCDEKRFALPKKFIIRKPSEFQSVYTTGRSFVGRQVILLIKENPDNATRAAVAAGKKLGKAHVRNRLKRMLRESFRLQRANIKDGYDVILVARKAAVQVKQPIVERCLIELVKKSGLWRGV